MNFSHTELEAFEDVEVWTAHEGPFSFVITQGGDGRFWASARDKTILGSVPEHLTPNTMSMTFKSLDDAEKACEAYFRKERN